jgi:hypothetical protein
MKLIDPHLRGVPRRRPDYSKEEKMHPLQIAAYRRMTPAEKLDGMARLYWEAREILEAGIRMRHPDWTDQDVADEVRMRMLYGTT